MNPSDNRGPTVLAESGEDPAPGGQAAYCRFCSLAHGRESILRNGVSGAMLFPLDESGNLPCGASPAAAAVLLESMGAKAVGFSSSDAEQLEDALAEAFDAVSIPLWAECTAPGLVEKDLKCLEKASVILLPNEEDRKRLAPEAEKQTLPCRPKERYMAAVSAGEVYWVDATVDLSEEIIPQSDFPEQILEAEDGLTGALLISINTEEELSLFTEYQYMLKAPICLTSSSSEMLIRALHQFCGRALYDGTLELDEELIKELVRKYGMIRL